MNRITRKVVVVAVLVVTAGAVSAGIAIAGSGDEQPLRGSTLDRATAVALKHAGGGKVTETETGDDGAAYSVEIRRADGTQIEVNMDSSFKVIGQEADDDGPNDKDEPGDD